MFCCRDLRSPPMVWFRSFLRLPAWTPAEAQILLSDRCGFGDTSSEGIAGTLFGLIISDSANKETIRGVYHEIHTFTNRSRNGSHTDRSGHRRRAFAEKDKWQRLL